MGSTSLADDEFPLLPIPDKPLWGENYAAVFFDPDTRVGGFISLGRHVQRNELWRSMVCLYFPNDRVLVSRNFGRSVDPKIPSSGVLEIDVTDPGRRLVFRFDGVMDERSELDLNIVGLQVGPVLPVKFELTFTSDWPIWDMHAGDGAKAGLEDTAINFNSADGHIEQNGQICGTLVCGVSETYQINGVATRDHSRGQRDYTNYKAHVWANGVFPSGRNFNLFAFQSKAVPGVAALGAAAVVDGVLHTLTPRLESAHWLERPDQLLQPLSINFESRTLGAVQIDCTTIYNSVPLIVSRPADHFWGVPIQSRLMTMSWINEQKVEWRWDGEVGHGHLERGNIRLDSASPDWRAALAARRP